MCTVKPYHICSQKIWIICRKASLPSPGGMDLGSGITFDIFTHVLHGSFFFVFFVFFFLKFIINDKKRR